MPNITKTYVEKLEAKDKRYIIWDDKISGFGIRVSTAGRKTYIMQYRTSDGRQKKPAIGVHGKITCEQARLIAKEWYGELAKGNDPTQHKMTLRQSPTVSELADRYYKEHVMIHNKKSSQYIFNIYIEKYIKPQLGTLKVIAVTKEDVMKLHLFMKDSPVMANRTIGALSKMMNLAETWGMRPQHSNPVLGLKKFKEESRERYLNEDELKHLFGVLDECEKDGSETVYMTSLIRLLLLTGARLSEIKNACWEWVDEINCVLRLPDSKTGKKIIHLSPAVFDVLKTIPRVKDNPYIIVGGVEGKCMDNAQKPWRRIRKKAGLDDVRMHDLRHTYASMCISQGMGLSMIAKLLGHSRVRTTERYAHLANDPISNAAAQMGVFISKKG